MISPDKSHLLAYLKHTPGFAQQVRTFVKLSVSGTLARVKERNELPYQSCVSRFARHDVRLETAT